MHQFVKCFVILCFVTFSIAGELKELAIGVLEAVPEEECYAKAETGDLVSVHYTGSLRDTGEVFDSSYYRGSPIQFRLGYGQVIQGWDEGLLNMCVNEVRKLQIPSHMAYGETGAGTIIPPGADLVFETKLVDIKKAHDEL